MPTQEASPGVEDSDTLIMHTTDIVVSFVANNSIGAQEVSSLIQNVHATLAGLGSGTNEEPRPDPAVSVRASVKNDHLVCLEDGKKLKMLRRHLMTHYNMTPDDYRAKWNLPKDYPMVAPNYTEKRRALAKEIGLGTKGRGGRPKKAPVRRAK